MIVPSTEFVALQLSPVDAATGKQNTVIEVRRGTAIVTVRWSHFSAAKCEIAQ
jgi:hypothetical protein